MANNTLVEKTADSILKMIQNKPYQVHDKLPTERELCEVTGAGRNTVREALKILVSRNIVEIKQGSGCFVSSKMGVSDDPLGFSMIKDRVKLTKDLLQVREMIEPGIASLAAQCADKEDVLKLEEVLKQMEMLMKQHKDYSSLDTKFHTLIAKCTHNIVMENLIPVISSGVEVFAKEVEETEFEKTMITHRKIFEAIKDHRPIDAENEMRYHLLYNLNRYEEETGNKK